MCASTVRPILAIDLGKYKSVACVYNRESGEVIFRSITSSREEFARLIERCRPSVVVIEACTLAGWVHDLCVQLDVPCRVANTASEAWKFKHSKRKTDRDDALRLAELAALNQLPTVTVPSKPVRERRALIATRQALIGRRTAAQNRIRAILLGQGLPAPVGHRAWTEAGRTVLRELAKSLADCTPDELWRGLIDLRLTELGQTEALIATTESALHRLAQADPATGLLQTIPGVGPRTAETIAAHLDDPKRFSKGKQVSAYAGLVPRQYQSGEMDRRGRITKRGPAILRKLLVECAWAMLRYNDWARTLWMRLTKNGATRKKPAIVALARRLLVRCWAMLRDGTPWRGPPPVIVTP